MNIRMELDHNAYDIVVERGALSEVEKHFDLKRKVLIVTDSGVPKSYSDFVAAKSDSPFVCVIQQGEERKSFESYVELLKKMLDSDFTRNDCVVAVGGGVVGDLAGFVAASYMRGVDFYNVPTTLLSQIDSSIGGKVAIDFEGVKNLVGAFYQPRKVIIDPTVLDSLEDRQFSSGLAEAIKMAATFDKELFELIENEDVRKNVDKIIIGSLLIKKSVVEKDEKETGLRRVLNFGHTIGHGIESSEKTLYHGECVALGMLPMCSSEVKLRLVKVLKKSKLPTRIKCDKKAVCEAMFHDKKSDGDYINTVYVEEIGSYDIRKESKDSLCARVKKYY